MLMHIFKTYPKFEGYGQYYNFVPTLKIELPKLDGTSSNKKYFINYWFSKEIFFSSNIPKIDSVFSNVL